MKTRTIISTLLILCAVSLSFFAVIPANAQKKKFTPATHMWVLTGNAVVHVYANSLEQCQMLTAQAARINSSEADCYNGETHLKRINCQKNPLDQNTPNCR
jgi:hypothetical protein